VYADVVADVRRFLLERARAAEAAGIPQGRIIVDAGLDLGKTWQQSLELLRRSRELADLGHPLLLSASNKTFLGRLLDLDVVPGGASHAAHAVGIIGGCRILRAHDVLGARRTADVLAAVLERRVQADA
jgi:dihydropteroate synthase